MTITDEAWCRIKAQELLATKDGKRIVDSEKDVVEFLLKFRRETENNYQWWKDNEESIKSGHIRV